ncbi:MAG: hypothetical protein H6Q74_2886 [Firmicutes bacterium]|nr:hypothetical protein [Bacillota bacterium]
MKKVLLTMVALAIMTSAAMAAPVTDLQKGQTTVGYTYWNPDVTSSSYDLGNTNANGFYAETGLTENAIVGVETTSGSIYGMDVRFTDVTLKSKIGKNFQFIVGNRSYDDSYGSYSYSTSKFMYGLGAFTNLNDKTTAYASILHSDIADDSQVGVNYQVSKEFSLNLNYRDYSEDGFSLKGVGFSASYNF